jgi:hypothetical protein
MQHPDRMWKKQHIAPFIHGISRQATVLPNAAWVAIGSVEINIGWIH